MMIVTPWPRPPVRGLAPNHLRVLPSHLFSSVIIKVIVILTINDDIDRLYYHLYNLGEVILHFQQDCFYLQQPTWCPVSVCFPYLLFSPQLLTSNHLLLAWTHISSFLLIPFLQAHSFSSSLLFQATPDIELSPVKVPLFFDLGFLSPAQAALFWGRLCWLTCCSAMLAGVQVGRECAAAAATISWPQRPVPPLSSVAQWPAQSEMPNIENPSRQMAAVKTHILINKFFDLNFLGKCSHKTWNKCPFGQLFVAVQSVFVLSTRWFLFWNVNFMVSKASTREIKTQRDEWNPWPLLKQEFWVAIQCKAQLLQTASSCILNWPRWWTCFELWWKPLKDQLPSECSQARNTCDIILLLL